MQFKDICNLKNIDLHVHTKYSNDSFTSPKRVADFANAHQKFIAITDHNEIKGALEAKKYDAGGYIIIGEEIKATDINAEILAYNIQEKISPGSATNIIEKIHQQGGVAVLPHPFRKGIILRKNYPHYTDAFMELIDGIEVYNARSTSEENKNALELARKFNKLPIKGSDAHLMGELYCANCNFVPLILVKNILTVIIKLVKRVI